MAFDLSCCTGVCAVLDVNLITRTSVSYLVDGAVSIAKQLNKLTF